MIRYREGGGATSELAFAGDVYSVGMISFTLVNSSDGWCSLNKVSGII